MLALAVSCYAQPLAGRMEDGRFAVSAPQFNFLKEGPALLRLKNGTPVAYDFHLALWVGSKSTVYRRSFERFVVSYDLWEEKFSVTGLRTPRPTASGLGPVEVAAWCLRHLSLPSVELSGRPLYWLRLDVAPAEKRPSGSTLQEPTAIDLKQIVEWFSRPRRAGENRWTLEAGPLRAQP